VQEDPRAALAGRIVLCRAGGDRERLRSVTPVESTPPRTPPPRILILDLRPSIEGGRWPVKRTLGDAVVVECDIVRDGHEQLRAVVRHRPPGASGFVEEPLGQVDPDLWRGGFVTSGLGRHRFQVEAWVDPFASWRSEIERKLAAGQEDLESEITEGAALLEAAAGGLRAADRKVVAAAVDALRSPGAPTERTAPVLGSEVTAAMGRVRERPERVRSATLEVDVDRERARVGAWYELFPRSWGGLAGVEERIPEIADLGFDVLYLPPIHPIGTTHRKGRNNSPTAEPGEPGSPWAIGAAEGGHTAVNPEIGTLADLESLVRTAGRHGVEIALDFAIQCSPDHPWLQEHPDWFHRRPDGTLKYAENPPKRYQDIYNVNFGSDDWRALWGALHDAVVFWVDRGVRVFRVDNPHTKPIPFWEWLIRTVREAHPDVVFLAEAFTSPARMYALAKAGFSQSYTYFTWKNSAEELAGYVTELAGAPSEFFRPNFFANTPDILHEYLQQGGRPAFEARLVLAATLSPAYGIYSGFENLEGTPVAPGSEEYLDSEKYEAKERTLDGPLLPLVRRLNEIRRASPPLRRIDVRFVPTENPALLAYVKGHGAGAIIVVVNVDPHAAQEGIADLPADLGLPGGFAVRDLVTGDVYRWHVGRNYVRLDPAVTPAHVLRVEA
jgi:starch synthase (maltosyl-transferring)